MSIMPQNNTHPLSHLDVPGNALSIYVHGYSNHICHEIRWKLFSQLVQVDGMNQYWISYICTPAIFSGGRNSYWSSIDWNIANSHAMIIFQQFRMKNYRKIDLCVHVCHENCQILPQLSLAWGCVLLSIVNMIGFFLFNFQHTSDAD